MCRGAGVMEGAGQGDDPRHWIACISDQQMSFAIDCFDKVSTSDDPTCFQKRKKRGVMCERVQLMGSGQILIQLDNIPSPLSMGSIGGACGDMSCGRSFAVSGEGRHGGIYQVVGTEVRCALTVAWRLAACNYNI